MGMPITLIVNDEKLTKKDLEPIFAFFEQVDQRYSPYIETSDVCRINRKELLPEDYSEELSGILEKAQQAKEQTGGYFDVYYGDKFDPSGIVKGWAIQEASRLFAKLTPNFYVDAGGDIQVHGRPDQSDMWRIGVRNPFDRDQNIAVVRLKDYAIATSGTAIRGDHIYDPVTHRALKDVVSLTVIAPKILDADIMATAAFSMGKKGIEYVERTPGYEGYAVMKDKTARMTSGWEKFLG